jgi:hypothetical protein
MNGSTASLQGKSDGTGLELVLAARGSLDRGGYANCHADKA